MISKVDRFVGSFLGGAVGDALGTTLEFRPPGSFEPITGFFVIIFYLFRSFFLVNIPIFCYSLQIDMNGGGPFRLQPGEWTDDTSMALCMAESLVMNSFYSPKDHLKKYVKWSWEGRMGSNGRCFDIGGTTSRSINAFMNSGNMYNVSTSEGGQGNGSLMRLCPVPLFFSSFPHLAITYAGDSSRTTHPHQACIDACRYFAGLIIGALQGASHEELCSPFFVPQVLE